MPAYIPDPDSFSRAATVTPNDTNNLAFTARAFYVGAGAFSGKIASSF